MTEKQLSIVVWYPSFQNMIMTSFLGTVNLENGTAEGITLVLLKFIEKMKLNPKNCIGLATDVCNVMSGAYNSVNLIK